MSMPCNTGCAVACLVFFGLAGLAGSAEPRSTLSGHADMVNSVAFSPDGKLLASGSDDGRVKLWDPSTGEEQATLDAGAGDINCLAFGPDGRELATGHDDGTVRLWNVSTHRLTATIPCHEGATYALAWSPDGTLLATGGEDETARLWNVRDRTALRTLRGPIDALSSVAFSRDGRTLAGGAGDGIVHRWNVASGEELPPLRGHTGDVYRVVFAPYDPQLLASVGEDETLRLWDLATGRARFILDPDQGWVLDAQFAPDGSTLVTSGGDGTVKLWNVKTGNARARLAAHDAEVYALAISPNGKLLATGSRDETVRIWDFPSAREGGLPGKIVQEEKSTVATPRKDWQWLTRHENFRAEATRGKAHVVFLGDSITEGWEDAGTKVWDEQLEPLGAVNFGINGDRTQHLLWRITQGGELRGLDPEVVVLLIGTNNTPSDSPEEIAAGVAANLKQVRDQLPKARVLLMGLFPRRPKADNPLRLKIREVNSRLARLADDEHVQFLDIGGCFLDEQGDLSRDVMPDYLHLSENGYRTWADSILPTLRKRVDQD